MAQKEESPNLFQRMTPEPVVLLLFLGLFLSVAFLFLSEKWFPMDGQMFQVMAGLVGFFTGALGLRINPKKSEPSSEAPPAATSTSTITLAAAKE